MTNLDKQTMKNEIRIACPEDIEYLVDLLNELFSLDLEFEPNKELQRKGLLTIIENPELGSILVKCFDHKIIGMVSVLYSISTALGGKAGVLEDMIINEKYRAKGIGSELLESAIRFAKENNCLRLTLLTDFNNETAIEFYKKFGFYKSQMIPMRLVF
jgi:ribosomal protein S18 acetylase RimI-like enzyme